MLSALLFWIGYLLSHKIATGKFVDGNTTQGGEPKKDQGLIPRNSKEIIGSLTGAVVFILGMLTGLYSLRSESFPLTFIAAMVFLWGYVIMHYSTTNELL